MLVRRNISELIQRIICLLDICFKKNIKLSPHKMQLGRKVCFRGVNISYNNFLDLVNIALEESKLAAIRYMKIPKRKKSVQSLMGMCSQLSTFFPDIMRKVKKHKAMSCSKST